MQLQHACRQHAGQQRLDVAIAEDEVFERWQWIACL